MLTTKQLQDIEALQKECEAFDKLQLKLNWEMLRRRDSDQTDFFYDHEDELIAFLGIYPFGSVAEVCGMVKPSERRKGHFHQLFSEAMDVCENGGYKKILLNAPASSQAAKAFLNKQGATYAFTEHQMQWEEKELAEVSGFTLRQADEKDIAMRVRLDVEGFGIDEESATANEGRIDNDEDTDMLMIEVDEEVIGKIRVKREDGEAWIYGFSILPAHQGRGIGRKVLQHVVRDQSAKGHSVHLEVETKNAHALSLYESIGFKVVHAQDYYQYK